MTGFDNKDQVEALANERSALLEQVAHHESESQQRRRELAQLDSQLTMMDQLLLTLERLTKIVFMVR